MADKHPMRQAGSLDDRRRGAQKRQTPFYAVEFRVGFIFVILLIAAISQSSKGDYRLWVAAGGFFVFLVWRVARKWRARHPKKMSGRVQRDDVPWES